MSEISGRACKAAARRIFYLELEQTYRVTDHKKVLPCCCYTDRSQDCSTTQEIKTALSSHGHCIPNEVK